MKESADFVVARSLSQLMGSYPRKSVCSRGSVTPKLGPGNDMLRVRF